MIYADTGNVKELYKPVMEMFLHGDTDYLAILRKQFEAAKVSSIEEDGYGIFIHFDVDPSLQICNPQLQNGLVTGLVGINRGGDTICGFAMSISDGMLSQIDGYPTGLDAWPREKVQLKNVGMDIISGKEYCSDEWGSDRLLGLTYGEPIMLANGAIYAYSPEMLYSLYRPKVLCNCDCPVRVDADDLDALVDTAVCLLLSGEGESLGILRNQYSYAEIKRRDFMRNSCDVYFRLDNRYGTPSAACIPSPLAGLVGIDSNDRVVLRFTLSFPQGRIRLLMINSLLMNAWPEGEITLWFLNRDENGCEYLTAERQDAPSFPLKDRS